MACAISGHFSVLDSVIQQAGDLKSVQRLLGHSNLSTTADVYTHISPESERRAALALEQAIYGDLFSNCSQNGNKNNSVALTRNRMKKAQPVTRTTQDIYGNLLLEVWLRGVDLNHRSLGYEGKAAEDTVQAAINSKKILV
jgi:hypothetical protein